MKSIKIILFLLALFSVSCTQDKEQENSTNTLKDTTKKQGKPKLDTIDYTLNDQKINDYFQKTYDEEKLIGTRDDLMLSITDSLFSKDTSKHEYYFIVFTKSMNGSDGFYAEALGLSSFKYILSNTIRFTEYFINSKKLTDRDFKNWVRAVTGEILISREGQEKEAIEELEKKLLDNVGKTSNENKEIIIRFIKELKSMMP